MRRRQFLGAAAALPIAGCRPLELVGIANPCLDAALPGELARHEVVQQALDGLAPARLWDGHVHLVGTGDSDSGIWINPALTSAAHPIQNVQFRFYLDAACIGDANVDAGYVARLMALQRRLPAGARAMLLAFDYNHDEQGRRVPARSAFHTPNEYAAAVAARFPQHLEWIASVHPYREDAAAVVEWCAANGARAVKWLPSAMGMDPASPLCDRFYTALQRADLPLLVHCGEEKAVHGAGAQEFNNPLRLRRPLEQGLRVIVAHCASLGSAADLDQGANGPRRRSLDLFARLMDEPAFERRLFGDISALTQRNRLDGALQTVIERTEWHPRLVNGSDYPLPAIFPLFSLSALSARGLLDREDVPVLKAIRRHNPLLFDLVLKRRVRHGGHAFDPIVFATRRLFSGPKRMV